MGVAGRFRVSSQFPHALELRRARVLRFRHSPALQQTQAARCCSFEATVGSMVRRAQEGHRSPRFEKRAVAHVAAAGRSRGSLPPSPPLSPLPRLFSPFPFRFFLFPPFSLSLPLTVPLKSPSCSFGTQHPSPTRRAFHFAKGKRVGAGVNAGLFAQVWKATQAEGRWAIASWVLKLGADVVFIRALDYGHFGNSEVFSRQALSTLLVDIAARE